MSKNQAADPANARPGGLAIVGSFTTKARKARGTGIRVFRHTGTARWEPAGEVNGLVNPSYLCADPSRNLVYSAHGDADFASAYAIDPASGGLTRVGEASSGGHNGAAIAMHPSGVFLFIANYSSGSITTLPINSDGSPSDAAQRLDLPGPAGPHRAEQTMSHPHDVVMDPSGRFLIVPDKGLDRVFVLRPDERSGELSVAGYAAQRPGSGPRHIAFHPTLPRAYVVNELDSTVASLAWDAATGVLTPLHVEPALPDSFFGHSIAAEIVVDPSGRFVYVSNRGADSVTRFSLDACGDHLTLQGWTPSGGKSPRYMTLSPEGLLVVANEQEDNIVEFEIDRETGDLTATNTVRTASPSSVAYL
jgi:6-phosphogluconolactonase